MVTNLRGEDRVGPVASPELFFARSLYPVIEPVGRHRQTPVRKGGMWGEGRVENARLSFSEYSAALRSILIRLAT